MKDLNLHLSNYTKKEANVVNYWPIIYLVTS